MIENWLFKGLETKQELQKMIEITIRSRQAGLTAALHGIPYVLEDSSQHSCGGWRLALANVNSTLAEVVICDIFPEVVG